MRDPVYIATDIRITYDVRRTYGSNANTLIVNKYNTV